MQLLLCHQSSPWTEPVEEGIITSTVQRRKQRGEIEVVPKLYGRNPQSLIPNSYTGVVSRSEAIDKIRNMGEIAHCLFSPIWVWGCTPQCAGLPL